MLISHDEFMLRALRVREMRHRLNLILSSLLLGVCLGCANRQTRVRIETDEPTVDAAVNVDGMDVGGMSMSDVQGMDVAAYCPTSTGLSIASLNTMVRHVVVVYVPTSYTNDNPMPVILNFHGGSGTADYQIATSDMRSLADSEGFIVIYPEGALTTASKFGMFYCHRRITKATQMISVLWQRC